MADPKSDQSTAERLIAFAGEIFASKGRGATVREICKAAECSIASINYYFGDKNQLYLRCVQAACERKQRLFPLPSLADSKSEDAPALLRVFLRTIANRMAAKSNLSWQNTLMLREVIAPTEGVADQIRETFQRDFGHLDALLGNLLGDQLNTDLRRNDLATQVLARCMFLRTGRSLREILELSHPGNEEPNEYADSIWESVLMQIDTLRKRHELPPLVWSPSSGLSALSIQTHHEVS